MPPMSVVAGSKQRVLSGVQPSGNLHIGNYLGALKNWVASQDEFDNFFCIVDLHAITVPFEPEELRQKTREVAAMYFACGIDPVRSTVFVQSHLCEHSELAWLLNCVTPMGWLGRMHQYKEKSEQQKGTVFVGLFDYPVLMAADILLYDADRVPVGEDQKQHVELTRDIAQSVNSRFGEGVFRIPQPMIPAVGARVMGLDDPTAKMSKSTETPHHAVGLLDPPKVIMKKFKRAVTDSGREIRFDEERAGLFNLLSIYQSMTGETRESIEEAFEGKGYGDLKGAVAEATIVRLEPIQARYREIEGEVGELDRLLAEGAGRARIVARATLDRVREAMGFLPPPG